MRTAILITFSFLYLFVASGLLGAAFGLTAALLLKASPHIHIHQVHMSVVQTMLCPASASRHGMESLTSMHMPSLSMNHCCSVEQLSFLCLSQPQCVCFAARGRGLLLMQQPSSSVMIARLLSS